MVKITAAGLVVAILHRQKTDARLCDHEIVVGRWAVKWLLFAIIRLATLGADEEERRFDSNWI